MNDVLNDALSNLEHDNYERSHKGYENRQADVAMIRAALAAQPAASAEPVAWPLASKEESDLGWTLDCRFLEQVEKLASQRTDYTTSMEATEQVLIAAAEVLGAPQPADPTVKESLSVAGPVAWVAADTLNSPHPTCVSSLAYMSQLDRKRGREYVPLYAAPVAAQKADDARDAERYRWLRVRWGRIADTYDGDSNRLVEIREADDRFEGWDVSPESLDAAIDAAIAQQESHT